jgi:DNA-binding MarR family transcriptional regulator
MDKRPRTDADADSGAGGLPMKVWRALDRAHCALQAAAESAGRRHGLTVGEMDVLDALRRRGPLPVGELRRRVRVSSGGATYLVTRLEERGLLERRGTPGDRRARVAALTAQGQALAAAAQPDYADAMRRALRGLGKKERRALLELLRPLDFAPAGEPEPSAEGLSLSTEQSL